MLLQTVMLDSLLNIQAIIPRKMKVSDSLLQCRYYHLR